MTRNLKVLLAAAMALVAIGAVNVSGAAAAGEQFHCSTEPCRYRVLKDGTGATAHWVWVISNSLGQSLSTTCADVTGHATTAGKTATQLTITGLVYDECTAAGAPLTVRMNECNYILEAEDKGGGVTTGTGARMEIECPTAKHIEIEIVETGCRLEITPQDLWGIHYHNEGTEAAGTTTITVEPIVSNIAVEVGKVGTGCFIDTTKTPLTGKITTGNFHLTGETDTDVNPVMALAWWK